MEKVNTSAQIFLSFKVFSFFYEVVAELEYAPAIVL